MRYLNTALLLAALTACSGNTVADDVNAPPQPSQTATQREIGKPFEMKIGETIAVGELRLTFRRVEADSRCPIDAVCVWAGDGEIALKIEQGSQTAVAALHTMLEPKKTEWNGYTVSLVTLTPVRTASTSVSAADYRAQLLVTR